MHFSAQTLMNAHVAVTGAVQRHDAASSVYAQHVIAAEFVSQTAGPKRLACNHNATCDAGRLSDA